MDQNKAKDSSAPIPSMKEQEQHEVVEELFAEELQEQRDFANPAGTLSSVSSIATSCTPSSAGTFSSLG